MREFRKKRRQFGATARKNKLAGILIALMLAKMRAHVPHFLGESRVFCPIWGQFFVLDREIVLTKMVRRSTVSVRPKISGHTMPAYSAHNAVLSRCAS
jgi:hypothetical protein